MLAQQQQAQQQQQQMMQQQQMAEQQQMLEQQRQQEEYMRQQMMQQQQQSLLPQHTSVGSNNPFAPRPPQQSLLDQDQSNQQQQQNNNNSLFSNSFLPVPTVQQNQPTSPTQSPISPPSPAKPAWQAPVKKDDGQHAHLANLLGAGREDGIDTFGNVGNLRESPCLRVRGKPPPLRERRPRSRPPPDLNPDARLRRQQPIRRHGQPTDRPRRPAAAAEAERPAVLPDLDFKLRWVAACLHGAGHTRAPCRGRGTEGGRRLPRWDSVVVGVGYDMVCSTLRLHRSGEWQLQGARRET